MPNDDETWPAGRTWVFQGTVLEDATAGTHVCTLTVTPGAGNELEMLYGRILDGNSATAQTAVVRIDDGTNVLADIINVASSTANTQFNFPHSLALGVTNPGLPASAGARYIISGTMRLILQITTTAVSITQTFSVVCRNKGALPTATLADTVGTPTLTTNTSAVF